MFISSLAIVTPDPAQSRKLFMDVLGLPLKRHEGDDYYFSENIGGSRHFGVWPLAQAAEACFGTLAWPADRPIPQACIEFEVGRLGTASLPPHRSFTQKGTRCYMARAPSHGVRPSPDS